ncbi:MAG: riboflavin synthase [Candidatus Omnitrophota bacterium]
MFSGIIEELGEVKGLSAAEKIATLEVTARIASQDVKIGDSVAVNGVCLTLVEKLRNSLVFQLMPVTLRTTNLRYLKRGDKVNLERALRLGDRVSGHFVLGHIDCVGAIRRKGYRENNLCFQIAVPPVLARYVLPKGSIAVDGISLTVAEKKSTIFSVYIIPHTAKNTTLGFKGSSGLVNVEFDILAKKSESAP